MRPFPLPWPGENLILRRDGAMAEMPAKFHERLEPGDRIRMETPGGGGWGEPKRS